MAKIVLEKVVKELKLVKVVDTSRYWQSSLNLNIKKKLTSDSSINTDYFTWMTHCLYTKRASNFSEIIK